MLCSLSISSPGTVLQFLPSLSRPFPIPIPTAQTLPCSLTNTSTCTSLSPSSLVTGSSVRIKATSSESTAEAVSGADQRIASSSNVVRDFYEGINRRDLDFVEGLIAENCVYEDLVFSSPFVGRKAIIDFFKKFTQSISSDLQFVIDDISTEDTAAIGVTWHLDWKGKPFPFSKGCSFYRLEVLDGKKQIVYGRDCVEPAAKPGEFALIIIRGVTSLLQQFPWLADRL
ncbi:Nuclear transport factor 2 (NTF2) family protein [Rhynchospora pubera]|uniref:Nuclear transport factor 2 (NTF2) family protein n=1 Tax=Rhynchospora pubera TaxID=906938 RepID=A0AAV8BZN8_9POAL|nr:Nuclear transport factor 2 (NTF2) family protein [Rhynchospora pubera]KAJ4748657.1 Nuclear transport factor 2 (NTF2) family protein [Rhynchospora pubera]